MKNIICAKAKELIVMDLDEGLDSSERQRLEGHLGECAHCKQWRDETAGILASVAADVPADPGEQFWKYYETSLQARLQEKQAPTSWNFLWKAVGAVALAAVVFMAIWLGSGSLDPVRHQVGEQASVSPALIQELEQLYGPGTDETPASSLAHDRLVAFTGLGASYSEEEPPEWFEVEDESNQLL